MSCDGTNIWDDLKRLFRAMDGGEFFGDEQLNKFNGGLFAPDPVAIDPILDGTGWQPPAVEPAPGS